LVHLLSEVLLLIHQPPCGPASCFNFDYLFLANRGGETAVETSMSFVGREKEWQVLSNLLAPVSLCCYDIRVELRRTC